ncbi:MAG: SRPBCC family protein [Solirubrobacteraceae bacterium]
MEFENTFEVGAPVGEVWDLLMDVERVAPCMPGAQVIEQTGEDAYKVAVKVRVGPMSMLYKGDVEIVERDAEAHRASMRAKATESRGQGTAAAQIRMALQERDGGTAASIVTEIQMSGKAAAMGQGVIQDVAASLTDTFARNLAELVRAGERPPEPEAAPAPATAAGAAAAAQPPPPPRPVPAPAAAEASLPLGKVAASVVRGRMRDPRVRLAAAGLIAILLVRIGIAIGRRR